MTTDRPDTAEAARAENDNGAARWWKRRSPYSGHAPNCVLPKYECDCWCWCHFPARALIEGSDKP